MKKIIKGDESINSASHSLCVRAHRAGGYDVGPVLQQNMLISACPSAPRCKSAQRLQGPLNFEAYTGTTGQMGQSGNHAGTFILNKGPPTTISSMVNGQ